MTNARASFVFTAVDKTKAAADSVRKGARKVGSDFDKMAARGQAASAKLSKSLRKNELALSRISKKAKSVGTGFSTSLTLPIVGLGAAVVKTAAQFESAMKRVEGLTGAVGNNLELLRSQAKLLGRDTAFSAAEAAKAQGLFAQAGFGVLEIVNAMPGALDLAAAGQLELEEAVSITSDVLRGYGKDASQATGVTDLLAAASTKANQTVGDIGEAMKFAASAASGLDVPIEETTAAISLLADRGLKGSIGGTALSKALVTMAKTSGPAADAFDKLGIKVRDSSGKLLPLADVIDQLNEKGVGTGEIFTIFGDRAGKAVAALAGAGGDALRNFTAELQNVDGAAKALAEKQLEGFSGQLKKLQSALSALAISIAESGLLDFLTKMAEQLTDLSARLSDTNPVLLRMATIGAAVVAAIGPALLIFGQLAASLGALTGLGATITSFTAGTTALSASLGALAAPLGVVIAAGVALIDGWRTASQELKSVVTKNFGAAAASLRDTFEPAVRIVGSIFSDFLFPVLRTVGQFLITEFSFAFRTVAAVINTVLGPVLSRLQEFLGVVIPAAANILIDAFRTTVRFIKERAADLLGVLADLFERASALPGVGDKFGEIAEKLRGFSADVREGAVAYAESAAQLKTFTQELGTVSDQVPEAGAQVDELTEKMRRLREQAEAAGGAVGGTGDGEGLDFSDFGPGDQAPEIDLSGLQEPLSGVELAFSDLKARAFEVGQGFEQSLAGAFQSIIGQGASVGSALTGIFTQAASQIASAFISKLAVGALGSLIPGLGPILGVAGGGFLGRTAGAIGPGAEGGVGAALATAGAGAGAPPVQVVQNFQSLVPATTTDLLRANTGVRASQRRGSGFLIGED
jgi:TP901 family phage tail tape measure protein